MTLILGRDLSIVRNANEKWVSFHLDSKTKRSTFIYKIPKNVNITCEEFGYPLQEKVNETKIYLINLENGNLGSGVGCRKMIF